MTAATATRLPERLAQGATLINAREVGVSIKGRPILHDVNFTLRAGEVVAFVGPNGSGKTTLLNVLSGDIEPETGTVELCGTGVGRWSTIELARRRAMLPQHVTLSFPYLVQDVVAMGRAPWRRTPREDEDDRAVAHALDATECSSLRFREFPTLSGGERARVSLARILAQEAQVLLLDEPAAALDIRHQEELLALLRQQAATGAGIVVVLHDLAAAASWCDRAVVMMHGELRADGPAHDVLKPALLSEVYGHEIDVVAHPVTGQPIVVPRRLDRMM